MTSALLERLAITCVVGAVALSGCADSTPANSDRSTTPQASASTGPSSFASSSSPESETSAPPRARGLTWTTLDSWPDGESPEAASKNYVLLKSRDGRSVVVRDGDAGEVVHIYHAPEGLEVNQVFLDPPTLAVVNADPAEERNEELVVIDIPSGEQRGLAEGAPQPWMGSWSMGKNSVTYGVRGPRNRYCMAEVRLDTLDGAVVECAPPRHGTNQVEQSPYGFAFTRFDDSRPAACGTARVRRPGADPVEVVGPSKCSVWETVALEGSGAIWAEVPDKEQIEVAEVLLRTDAGEPESLGYGTTGSLTWCGKSVWFLRQQESRVMRWSAENGLEEAFRLAKSAVLSTPVCTGKSISILEARDAPGPGNKVLLHRTPAED